MIRTFRAAKAASLCAAILLSQQAAAQTCPFSNWTSYRNVEVRRTTDEKAYFFVTSRQSVDADGAPKSYHPSDAGQDCPSQGRGLDCPGNAGYPNGGWRNVLVADGANPNRPYVQRSDQMAPGFFVSQTSLRKTVFAGLRDPRSYVDATKIPYLVMPGPFYEMAGTGRMGDIGFALHLDNGKVTSFVVADAGPAEPLGEGSIALWSKLGGNNPNPRDGSGRPLGRVAYVVFPYSGATSGIGWPIDLQLLEAKANQLLITVGGVETLRRCAG